MKDQYTEIERKAHIQKYPLPKWCRKKKKTAKNKAFLLTDDWKQLRKLALSCYENECMRCGSTKEINVDHIKPKSKYPELALEFNNLQILCWGCNKVKGNKDETDYRFVNKTATTS